MTLYYPQQSGDFDLIIPLDKSAIHLGMEEVVVSLRYEYNQWYMSIWHNGKYLTQNQTVKSGSDLFEKFKAYKIGQFIVYGDATSPSCFLNWPVEVGYA